MEEFLRWASPVYHFRRTATKDLEFGGKNIKDGDKVVTWFASGNRDSAVFEDPYKFDISRNPNEHMTFGRGGPHMCLGNALARLEIKVMFEDLVHRIDFARLEIKVMFEDLVHRIDSMERTGPIRRLRSNFVNGIKDFPVKVNLR